MFFRRPGHTTGKKGGAVMQSFSLGPILYYGDDALSQLSRCRARSVLVVTDSFFDRSGLARQVAGRIPGADVTIFSQVTPDPSVELVARGAEVLERLQPEALLALGGGSPIDCAKAMVYTADRRPLFIAVPTTSGTGSEVTRFAIVSHGGVKHPLIDETLRPDWAILDPGLLQGLPPALVADAGMDTVTHCLEALAADGASPLTDGLALEALALCVALLPRSYRGETAVRGRLHLAATMAGLAFDHAGLGLCHALAHALGGRFHVAHGRLGGVLLPAVVAFNGAARPERYRAAAKAAGVSGTADSLLVRGLAAALERLRAALGLPATLAEAGIDPGALEAALDSLVEAALADPCLAANPRPAGPEDLRALLRRAAR